ncbi:MAG: hypothetical protein Kow0074_16350 [Candidatus Zixiibacteriota bacterium]
MSTWASRVIGNRATQGTAKIWVYFTDKGFADKTGLAAVAKHRGVALTDRAAIRRAKVGRDQIEFYDVPVRDDYIRSVEDLGAQLRQRSRWLNAASFEVPLSIIPQIGDLPFVHKIDPVLGYGGSEPIEFDDDKSMPRPDATGTTEATLDYGASLGQLTQINVPAVHDLGYNGQGVLVAMFDTGYRKDHVAFAQAYSENRVLAERDFVFNDNETQDEPEDLAGQHNHGTLTWSALGGQDDGNLYGPAYGASFILAKTEDTRSETPVEEDNWVAAMEWADSIGADVISTSLSYTAWYTYSNFDGDQAVTTIAADLAASLGIVVCASAGNSGPSAGTIGAPADADSILAVGAVTAFNTIASFSSRGPTFDGRIKPEVCAQGQSTACANPGGTTTYTTASGTSLSCPLVGGCAAVLLSAHPEWTPMQVREALMQTASQAATPDNSYGWGIVDLLAAVNYSFGNTYVPGDLNDDSFVDAVDINIEINIVFSFSDPPDPPATPDINQDSAVNVLDVVYLIDYVYRAGPEPPQP